MVSLKASLERPFRARSLAVALLLGALSVVGCKGCSDGQGKLQGSAGPTASSQNPVPDRVILSLLSLLPSCDIEHRGLLIDMGTAATRGRVSGDMLGDEGLVSSEHDGATWASIKRARTHLEFNFPQSTTVFGSARLVSRGARSVAFSLDGQPLGSIKLSPGEIRIVRTPPTALPIDPGAHTLDVAFSPRPKDGAAAELDWVRVGVPDDLDETYGAPTLPDVVSESAALSKVPHRSISLRAPAVLRCPVRLPKLARLRMATGVFGEGEATMEVAVRTDGKDPVKVVSRPLKGGASATWTDIDESLDAFAGQLVHLELRVPQGAKESRVLFGDPEIVVPTVAPPEVPPAQVVVVVVLSGVDRSELPPYSKQAEPNLERISRLADSATVFMRHRNPTSIVPGVVASLLTGLSPMAHTVTDYGARLPESLPTILESAHDGSVQTAFFTGVPHTFAPFGFQRGADEFAAPSPVSGEGEGPLGLATKFLEKSLAAKPNGRIFVLVHTRGGHPPWTVGGKQLDTLPPADYTGSLQPRRAAQQLALLRKRKKFSMPQSDQIRLGALHAVGLADEDRALGKLLDAVEAANVEERTLVIVTTDGSSGLSTYFSDEPPFNEESLSVPLFVIFPKHLYGGQIVDAPSEAADLTRTVLKALELPPMRHGLGQDLAGLASGLPPVAMRPIVAVGGDRYLARWDSLVMSAKAGSPGALCDVLLDPTCSFDRRSVLPFAADAMARGLDAEIRRSDDAANVVRQTATIDDDTLAALRVWGSME